MSPRPRPRLRIRPARAAWLLALLLGAPTLVRAQEEAPVRTVSVSVGKSAIVESPVPLRRISIAQSAIAEAIAVSRNEVLVNGVTNGSTSLILWGTDGTRRFYSVEVTPDAQGLEEHLSNLFPDDSIRVTASKDALILSGTVTEESVARRARALAEASGVPVVDNLSVPSPRQILLQVRMAEVSRTALEELSVNFLRIDPFDLRGEDEGFIGTNRNNPPAGNFLNNPPGPDETFSDAVNFYLFNPDAQLAAFIRALRGKGLFRSLAEPNLLALDGKEASFLAGGEFPFPVVQGGGTFQGITVIFKEFGIRLVFTPTITNSGNINLKVAPEVSSLDFASGLQVSGFQIPTILSRRAETEVELRDGQTFAIAGLIDNSVTQNVDRVPILGDIPILGALFRSKEMRQNRSELLVLVTPHLVQPSDAPPPIPTGEPDAWDWDESLETPPGSPPGTGTAGQ